MGIFEFILIVIIVLVLAIVGIDYLPIGDATLKMLLKFLAVALAVLAIAHRAGLF